MAMFAPLAPIAEAGAELHHADGTCEHFQNKFKKFNILLLCSDSASKLFVWNSVFSFSPSLSFFFSLFVLKYYIFFSTLGCWLFPFCHPLALCLSDGKKEECIEFGPCLLVVFVYLLVNYADISPLGELVCCTARCTVHLWTLPGLMCPQGQFSVYGEARNEIKSQKKARRRKQR